MVMKSFLQGINIDKKLTKQYGDTVGMFEGRQPALITQDDEMLREIMVKQFHNFSNRRNFEFPKGTNVEYGKKVLVRTGPDLLTNIKIL